MNLKEALENLDPLDDDLWTKEGAPKLDTLKELTGGEVSRQDVIDVAPQFSRDNPEVEVFQEASGEEQGNEEVEPFKFDLEAMFEADSLPDTQQFAAAMLQYEKDDVRLLDAIHEAMKENEAELYASIDKIKSRAQKMAALALVVSKRREFVEPPMSDQERRMAFIKSQNALRASKKSALDGIPLDALKKMDPRSPLDQAMAMKRTRKDQRPTRV